MSQLIGKFPKLFALCAIGITALATYANSLPNSFHFDDLIGIVRNPTIRSLNNIPAYFIDPHVFALGSARDWRPILQITYALNYFIAGLDPTVFRIFNLLAHAGSAFLIFLIVAEIIRRFPAAVRVEHPLGAQWIGLLSGLLFVLHTANDQAVNYIWARSSVLAAGFYLLAFYCYLRGPLNSVPGRRTFWTLGGLASFALGLGTKATAASLPAVILFYEIFFLNPAGYGPIKLFAAEPKRIKKYFSLGFLLLAYLVIRVVLVPRMFIGHDIEKGAAVSVSITPYSYLLTQFRAWVFYLKLFIWPHPLSIDFTDFNWSRSLWEPTVLASLALVIAILASAWWARKFWPLISFFIFWIFITLLPESSFIPLADPVVGYRAYLPYVGAAVVVIVLSQSLWHWLWSQLNGARAGLRSGSWSIYGVVMGALLLILAAATIYRNRIWRDEVTLWSDVLARNPDNPRAHMALGVQFLQQKQFAEAEDKFASAIRLAPKAADAYALRGYLRAMRKNNDEALADFAMAIKLDRRLPYTYAYRGDLYNRSGELDKALADFQTAIKLLPSLGDAHFGAAMVYVGKEDIPNATATCRTLVNIDPDDKRGYDCLGTLLIAQNRAAEAIPVYQQATARIPQDSELWAGLGNAYQKIGMFAAAEKAFNRANALTNLKSR